jgi:threonine/homoserine/homoserine lactone efflux protein
VSSLAALGSGAVSFLAVSALVIVTPGQDTALTIKNTLTAGRRAGRWTAAGVSSGQAVWVIATAAGLAALLRASEPAFVALRIAGACYLVGLGLQALLGAVRRKGGADGELVAGLASAASCRRAFRQGLLSNLGNPKMAVFFTSLLPQFTTGGAAFLSSLVYGSVFVLITLVWLTAYAGAVARAGHVLQRTRVRRALEAVTGTVLVGLGLRIAADAR